MCKSPHVESSSFPIAQLMSLRLTELGVFVDTSSE